MQRLSPTEAKRVHQAILSAFSYDDLRQLTLFELNERLENLSPPGSMASVAFELVAWAERAGQTEALIKAMKAARPNNAEVQSLDFGTPAANEKSVDTQGADQRRRLRGLLLDQFPRPSDLDILVADSLGRARSEIAGGATQTDVCFNLVQWLWIDPPGRLRPFLGMAVRERPNQKELRILHSELFPA
jgi:hypothetical protein